MAMKIEYFLRHFREAFLGFKRNIWLSSASLSVIGVSLFIFGISAALMFNVLHISKKVDDGMALKLAINNCTEQEQAGLLTKIKTLPEVSEARFIPKEEVFATLRKTYGNKDKGVLTNFDDKLRAKFPDFIEVTAKNPKDMSALKNSIKNINSPLISEIGSNMATVDKLVYISKWVNTFLLSYAIGLAVLSAVLISNTIKLNIIARQEEIEIQRLVGASNWFIRWPFLIEGTLIGLAGALIPIPILILNCHFFNSFLEKFEVMNIVWMDFSTLCLYVSGSVILLGVIIGAVGSIISVHRFLKT